MNNELQSGMMALVYGLVRDHQHNGKMVELIEQVDGEGIHNGYKLTGVGAGDWLCEHDSFEMDGLGVFGKDNLLPIKPEADPLDVTTQEYIYAH